MSCSPTNTDRDDRALRWRQPRPEARRDPARARPRGRPRGAPQLPPPPSPPPALTACLAPPSCPGRRWAQPPAAPRPQIPPGVSAAFHPPLSAGSRRADLLSCSRRDAGSEREGIEAGGEFCNSGMASGESAAADRQRSTTR